MSAKPRGKRTGGKVPLVRGEAVVRVILAATLEELARTGYGALRIEGVAARAGVNKTTVYRRWATKEDLVRAALLSLTLDRITAPNTGSLRSDLLTIARRTVAMMSSPEGQGLMRMIIAEGPDSELMAIAKSLHKTHEAVPRSVIAAAQGRGEIAAEIDGMLLFDTLGAAIHRKICMDRESVNDNFLDRLVDLLLFGALAPHKRHEPPAVPTPSRRRRREAKR